METTDIQNELDEGNKLALALVDHLNRMGGAASAIFTVQDRAVEYVVIIMPKSEIAVI